MREGAAWELSSTEILAAVSRKVRKRIGQKKAKEIERSKKVFGALGPEEATRFRSMAARANYLALDRPDISFGTKELCRCFGSPTTDAMAALKRLVR